MSEPRTIRVTGVASMSVAPDQTRVQIRLSDESTTYEGAMAALTQASGELTEALGAIGFGKEQLRTTQFMVQPVFNEKRRNGEYHQYLAGYRYRHHLLLRFSIDNTLLNRLIEVLTSLPSAPAFDIDFGLSDEEGAKEQLIAQAVKDATRKAKTIAQAASVRLGPLVTIDYAWQSIQVEMTEMHYPVPCGAPYSISEVDVTPNDVTLHDTINMVWSMG